MFRQAGGCFSKGFRGRTCTVPHRGALQSAWRTSTAAASTSTAPALSQAKKEVKATRTEALRVPSFFGAETSRIRASEALFRACTDAASRRAWFSRCNVGDDWQSKHLLRTCYVWLIHKRMLQEGDALHQVDNQFFEEFWGDTIVRMRNAGVQELLISKNLKMVQEYSFELLLSLDHAMSLATKDEQLFELGGALWGLLYKKPEKFVEKDLVHLASHLVRAELETLSQVPAERFTAGAVEFADAPDFSRPATSGVELVYVPPDGYDDAGEWRAAMDVTGKLYWWHPQTRQATYDRPSVAAT